MPLEAEDPDGEDFAFSRRERFGTPIRSWWRPSGTWGRTILALGALGFLAAFAFALHASREFLERDARFRIAGSGNIQASGLAEVTRADLLPVFGEDIGRNIFYVPLGQRRKQLEQISWVQQATVMRVLPNQIRISLVERKPVAFVRHGQQIGLVDANGVLLNMPVTRLAQHHYSFPVLTGIDGADPLPSRKARMDLYLRLMQALDANGQHNSEQISEIDLTDPEDARVLMPEQGADILAHFGQDHFLERFQRYQSHIAEWRQQYPHLAEVDLRYDRQVVLEMAKDAAPDPNAASIAANKPSAAAPATKHSTGNKTKSASHAVKYAAKVVKKEPRKEHVGAKSRAEARRHTEKLKARRKAEAHRAALRRLRQREAEKNHSAGGNAPRGR